MTETDRAIMAGAVRALRRRAERQADRARAGSAVNEAGVLVRTGEAAIAARLAETLAKAAAELERET